MVKPIERPAACTTLEHKILCLLLKVAPLHIIPELHCSYAHPYLFYSLCLVDLFIPFIVILHLPFLLACLMVSAVPLVLF